MAKSPTNPIRLPRYSCIGAKKTAYRDKNPPPSSNIRRRDNIHPTLTFNVRGANELTIRFREVSRQLGRYSRVRQDLSGRLVRDTWARRVQRRADFDFKSDSTSSYLVSSPGEGRRSTINGEDGSIMKQKVTHMMWLIPRDARLESSGTRKWRHLRRDAQLIGLMRAAAVHNT
ncbi:hypothetical protein L249_8471 [Ophiocordyceps polyrhachis-furcata BCC 54312]|uniref:Uncharacterized protein n=1 Tax=Ophiocordyceps polyrhachis-furcata BCC 54312 TaxID=1330021 RepID=A0A367L6N7_9HYPO|nr:hypothetical protein L249_8471 [Ophiocordyceps polyrhachis-furcata BCC 54312]